MADKKHIFDALRKKNIGVQVHYIPLHLQPYYKERFGYKEGDFPNAERYYSRSITLPLFPKMSDHDVDSVINAVIEVCENFRSLTKD